MSKHHLSKHFNCTNIGSKSQLETQKCAKWRICPPFSPFCTSQLLCLESKQMSESGAQRQDFHPPQRQLANDSCSVASVLLTFSTRCKSFPHNHVKPNVHVVRHQATLKTFMLLICSGCSSSLVVPHNLKTQSTEQLKLFGTSATSHPMLHQLQQKKKVFHCIYVIVIFKRNLRS